MDSSDLPTPHPKECEHRNLHYIPINSFNKDLNLYYDLPANISKKKTVYMHDVEPYKIKIFMSKTSFAFYAMFDIFQI